MPRAWACRRPGNSPINSADTILGVSQVLAAGEWGQITQSLESLVDRLEPLAVDKNVDVDCEPAKTVSLKRHAPRDSIWNTDRFQSPSDFPQGLEY